MEDGIWKEFKLEFNKQSNQDVSIITEAFLKNEEPIGAIS